MDMQYQTILVTGGTGYIGSHTVIELQESGYNVIIVDNLSNSHEEVVSRIAELSGVTPLFYNVDLLDASAMNHIFDQHTIDAVIHFAGLKAVGESVQKPLSYYHNNVTGTLNLFETMLAHQCYNVIFSSSATVYGDTTDIPVKETAPRGIITNPYGQTKAIIEQIITDVALSNPDWNAVTLRYFNPAGAHKSGRIGEDPNGIPNNLFPYISQVALGTREALNVFGSDYETPDGTGVRDYIHVVDLARGHVAALQWMAGRYGVEIFNLGSGRGYSVLEVAHAYEKASGRSIRLNMTNRRAGDVAELTADPTKAHKLLNWSTQLTLNDMCEDSWRWQKQNPQGYTG